MNGDNSLMVESGQRITGDSRARVLGELTKGSNASVVVILSALIEEAFENKASDIHIDPTTDGIDVRFRIDGLLQLAYTLPLSTHAELLSRLKILCGLRTDEHQAAQDGRLRHTYQTGTVIDVRVSIMPLYYGENAVLRLLIAGAENYSLQSLGFSEYNQQLVLSATKKPYGMILATGPTGSGKTTTLYTLLTLLNNKETAIVTIEDPIEYAITGINQIQVNPRTGLTFAHGLRSMLRQDPNTIMVGEIRDGETAGLAVNIALTGHIVVSTLHTNDAATTLPRLLDMKIEPYLIASTVTIAIGQRLVRKLCTDCKKEKLLTALELQTLTELAQLPPLPIGSTTYSHVGCVHCNQTGFKGRIGIQEVLVVTPVIREAILARAQASVLRTLAIKEGMIPLLTDGLAKAMLGITTIEEVLKINYE